MMQIILCENCKQSSIPFGQVSVDIDLKKSEKCCEHCNSTKNEAQHYFFCSMNCFMEYMRKVIEGKKTFKWKELVITKTGRVTYG